MNAVRLTYKNAICTFSFIEVLALELAFVSPLTNFFKVGNDLQMPSKKKKGKLMIYK